MNLPRFHHLFRVGTFLLILFTISVSADEHRLLNLEDSLQIAKQNNLLLKVAEQGLESAKAQLKIARSSLLPRISANGNYTYFKDVQKSVISAEGGFGFPMQNGDTDENSTPNVDNESELIELEFGAHHNLQGNVSLTQPIFAWGRYYYGFQAAKLQYEAAEKEFSATENKLRLEVYQSFYRVLIAQEFVKVAEQRIELVQKQLKIAETSFEAGVTANLMYFAQKFNLQMQRHN